MKHTLSAAMLLAITAASPSLADNAPQTVTEPPVSFEVATNSFLEGLNFPPYVIGENSCYIPESNDGQGEIDPTQMLLSGGNTTSIELVA